LPISTDEVAHLFIDPRPVRPTTLSNEIDALRGSPFTLDCAFAEDAYRELVWVFWDGAAVAAKTTMGSG
jgi:hypothetical protein